MKDKLGRCPILAGTVALSAAGFFLRRHQLKVGFYASGIPNGNGVWVLAAVCVLAVALFAAVAFLTGRRPGFRENYPSSLPAVFLLVAAAGMMVAANAPALLFPDDSLQKTALLLDRLLGVLGVVTGLCFIAMAATQYQKKEPTATPWLMPIVYYILRLIISFKGWSVDPIILDYCFKLFALVFVLMGTFYVAGFVFDNGKRPMSVFFCLGGAFFSIVSLADGGMLQVLSAGAAAAFLLANAWQLLGKAPIPENE